MSLNRRLLLSLLAALAVWLVFAWPLPRFAARGIPSSAHNIERESARHMIVGDHLQLHYFYWLFSDMLAGGTPLFENRYEFNTGNDAERYRPGAYNLPLSLVYAAVRPFTTRAFAWNTVLFLTLWLTLLWTWLSLRGLIRPEWLALLAALTSIALPYRWIMLCGGSPTGLAMMWLALLAFGLSLVLREDRPSGGLWVAFALAAAYFNDRHVFFFSFLALPFLALLFLLLRPALAWRDPAFRRSLALGSAPVLLAVLLLGAVAAKAALTGFADTSVAGGRTVEEVLKYAPALPGLVTWGGKGTNAHLYLGWPFLALGALFLGHAFLDWKRKDGAERRLALAGLLLWLAFAAIVILAMGPRGPFDGALFDLVRAHVPGSKALRQPAKILALLTPLLPLAAALAFAVLRRAGRLPLAIAAVAVLIGDHALQIHPSVCLLDTAQGAYAAVAADAAAANAVPRVVILPLWPGDSDWAAVYQHYVSLYRLRMLNGYRPIVPKPYQKLVAGFTSLNTGRLSDSQAAELLRLGFRYILFHEDAFPEKVSPFSVVFTRDRLLAHPRLDVLAHDQTVWAFRIREQPRAAAGIPAPRDGPLFPARYWSFARSPRTNTVEREDAEACFGVHTVLTGNGVVTGRAFRVTAVREPALLLRLRGEGGLRIALAEGEEPLPPLAVRTNAWTWFRVPLDPEREREVKPVFTAAEGSIDTDFALFLSGTWVPPEPGRPLTLAAERFFHAGWSDPATGYVHLRPDHDPADFIFYGPRLPMGPGRLKIGLDYETPAPAGEKLGRVVVDHAGDAWGPFDVIAGHPFTVTVDLKNDKPLSLNFQYRRRAPVTLKSVTFTLL